MNKENNHTKIGYLDFYANNVFSHEYCFLNYIILLLIT